MGYVMILIEITTKAPENLQMIGEC